MDSESAISGPFLVVGTILLIAFCLLWATPLTLTLISTRKAVAGANLDRQDRTEAMVFCYTMQPETVQRIHSLPTLAQKTTELQAEYLRQNPQALDVEAKAVVKIYLELYGSEIGEGYAAALAPTPQTSVQKADGTVIPIDQSDFLEGRSAEAAAVTTDPDDNSEAMERTQR